MKNKVFVEMIFGIVVGITVGIVVCIVLGIAIIIDKYGFIKKYIFSKKNSRLYECDKIKIYNNSFSEDDLRSFYEISNNIIIFQYKNKITLYYKNG